MVYFKKYKQLYNITDYQIKLQVDKEWFKSVSYYNVKIKWELVNNKLKTYIDELVKLQKNIAKNKK